MGTGRDGCPGAIVRSYYDGRRGPASAQARTAGYWRAADLPG